MDDLMKSLALIRATTKVFIFDSCFSGVPRDPAHKWATKGVVDARGRTHTATGAQIVATLSARNMTVGLFSTKPGGVSYESVDGSIGGVFTHFLLQAASDKQTYPNGVTVAAAAAYAKTKGDVLLKSMVTSYGDTGYEDRNEDPKVINLGDPDKAINWSGTP
jgi:hypothetical protein